MSETLDHIEPLPPPRPDPGRRKFAGLLLCAPLGLPLLAACGGGDNTAPAPIRPLPPPPAPLPPGPPVSGPAWSGHARDAQHSALGAIASQPFNQIRWWTEVDLAPQ